MLFEILWIVFWVIGLVFLRSWPNQPPWGTHAYYMLMFALTGLVLFGGWHPLLLR